MPTPLLVLASTSPYRRELLARLRQPFDVAAPGVDETPRMAEVGPELARRLAREKADAVSLLYPDRTVIGSDQVAMLGEIQLDKPGSRERAVAQLTQASGQTVAFYTAVCVISRAQSLVTEALDITHVVFRRLDPNTIEQYVDLERPFDCAGSAKAEGLGIALIERIEAIDPTGLIGLPLISLAEMLPRHRVPLFEPTAP